jgi:hypothetical protein
VPPKPRTIGGQGRTYGAKEDACDGGGVKVALRGG